MSERDQVARRRSPARILAAALGALSLGAAPVAAQTPPETPKPQPARNALGRVADALAQGLSRAPLRAIVVAAPLAGDALAPRGAQLVVALAAQLAGRRGPGSRAHADPLPLPAAREAARGESVLVHLTVEVAGGKLRA